MKANMLISEAILAYRSGKSVSVVCKYKKAVKVLKAFISLPETKIIDIELGESEFDGYDGAWLVDINDDGAVFCQKAINDLDNMPYRGDGYYLIDEKALGGYKPEDFVLGGAEIRVV